eukprot:5346001-Pleurochrysis_carterae.AAC.1
MRMMRLPPPTVSISKLRGQLWNFSRGASIVVAKTRATATVIVGNKVLRLEVALNGNNEPDEDLRDL